ncbi:MAG: glycosyltransferase [Bacteroides sp.]|nr:glycosyltransferase [Bacteroides sp.]
MITVIQLIETLLYVYLFFSVGYLVLFAVASLFAVKKDLLATDRCHRFLVLIPSYKEDKVIGDTVQAALSQLYPQEYFRVMVISDQMNESTNDHLRSMGAEVLEIHYEESSKALALQSAIRSCQSDAPSDYVVILDADNIIASDYLEQVNRYTQQTQCKVLQTHRTAKNLNTSTAILDAAIEEMNNSIFRLGHVQLGFSSALIGSGMVMDYIWFAENIFHTHSAGEDKELEELLLRQHIHIHYADSIRVLDEKVQQKEAMGRQRKRWIATQFFLAGLMWKRVPQAILKGNGDYLLKAFQSIIPPRSILMALLFMLAILTTFIPFLSCEKWWVLLIALLAGMYIAIPTSMRNKQLYQALKEVPYFVCSMVVNLFRSKGASKKFIHTSHG